MFILEKDDEGKATEIACEMLDEMIDQSGVNQSERNGSDGPVVESQGDGGRTRVIKPNTIVSIMFGLTVGLTNDHTDADGYRRLTVRSSSSRSCRNHRSSS